MRVSAKHIYSTTPFVDLNFGLAACAVRPIPVCSQFPEGNTLARLFGQPSQLTHFDNFTRRQYNKLLQFLGLIYGDRVVLLLFIHSAAFERLGPKPSNKTHGWHSKGKHCERAKQAGHTF